MELRINRVRISVPDLYIFDFFGQLNDENSVIARYLHDLIQRSFISHFQLIFEVISSNSEKKNLIVTSCFIK